jgi:gliding motility-associated-like protein
MNKKLLLIFAAFFSFLSNNYAQCVTGQDPASAFPACGTSTFSQNTVPACGGTVVPVPNCVGGSIYTDVNPFYYKFTCYTAAPLIFKLTPLTRSDDYDWQIFDITNRNPMDIFNDASLFVCCNWSGLSGATGTSLTAANLSECEGNTPNFSKAPTLIIGHEYLMLVSHFTVGSQSGYDLTFSGSGASGITNPIVPKVDTVYASCGGDELYVKLSKPMRCASIEPSGSDFVISNGGIAIAATGVGCNNGFDADSIIVKMLTPLPAGPYTLQVKTGSDNNTILDICGNGIATGLPPNIFKVFNKPNPLITFQNLIETCKSDTVTFWHNGNNGVNNWFWTFDGSPTTSTANHQTVVYNSFVTRTTKLVISNGICKDSFSITLPIKPRLAKANFVVADTTCPLTGTTFTDSSKGNIVAWKWNFGNGKSSVLQSPPSQFFKVTNNFYLDTAQLIVTNDIGCKDSTTKTFVIKPSEPAKFDSIVKPGCSPTKLVVFIKQKIDCQSISTLGNEFTIFGPEVVTVIAAKVNCGIGGAGSTIELTLANPIKTTGTYKVLLNKGSDGNSILNICGIEVAYDTVAIKIYAHINTNFLDTVKLGCFRDTISFFHDGNNETKTWQWIATDSNIVYTSKLQNPTFYYKNFVLQSVQLIVGNMVCSDTSINKILTIGDHVVKASFFAASDTICPTIGNGFFDSSKGNIKTWFWNFGNGNTSNLKSPPKQIYPVLPNLTKYDTKLTVTNALGCKDSILKPIFIYGTIPTVFDSIIPPQCASNIVQLFFKQKMVCSSITSSGSEFTIFGSDTISVVSASINCINGVGTVVSLNLSRPINKTGFYKVALGKGSDLNGIVNDCGVETVKDTVSFFGFAASKTNFTITSKLGCFADTVTYKFIGNNLINKWQWKTSDVATIITDSVATFIHTNLTNRVIELIISNGICTDTVFKPLPVIDHSIKANFYAPDTICPNTGTQFIDSSLGIITKWKWNIGNGNISSLKNPAKQYYAITTKPVTYTIKLNIKNIVGCIDSMQKNYVVLEAPIPILYKMVHEKCAADSMELFFTEPFLCSTIASDFSDFSFTGPDSIPIKNVVVNCVDNKAKSLKIFLQYPVAKGGLYHLNIKKGSDGNSLTNACGIEVAYGGFNANVYENPIAKFDEFDIKSCGWDTLLLLHNKQHLVTSWQWFDDNVLVSQNNKYQYIYNNNYTKNIRLIVSNLLCSDTFSKTISIRYDSIRASFAATEFSCPTEPVFITENSIGNIINWSWNFGNRTTSGAKNPLPITYSSTADTGFVNYTIRLVVNNATPCYDTAYKIVKISNNCLLKIPTAFTPNGDGRNDYLYPLNAYKAINLKFVVYNRNGQKVFETANWNNKWNGTINGQPQPTGTYIWTLIYTDIDTNKTYETKGTTVLIR